MQTSVDEVNDSRTHTLIRSISSASSLLWNVELTWHSPLIQNYALTPLLLMPCPRCFHNICVKSHRPSKQRLVQRRSRYVADETVKLWHSFSRLLLLPRDLRWFLCTPTTWTSPVLQVRVRSEKECCCQAASSVLVSIRKEDRLNSTPHPPKKK